MSGTSSVYNNGDISPQGCSIFLSAILCLLSFSFFLSFDFSSNPSGNYSSPFRSLSYPLCTHSSSPILHKTSFIKSLPSYPLTQPFTFLLPLKPSHPIPPSSCFPWLLCGSLLMLIQSLLIAQGGAHLVSLNVSHLYLFVLISLMIIIPQQNKICIILAYMSIVSSWFCYKIVVFWFLISVPLPYFTKSIPLIKLKASL